MKRTGPGGGRRGRRLLRAAAVLLAGVVLLLAAAALLLALRPARERVLDGAFRRAGEHLPGALRADLRWPSLGTIEGRQFLWVDGADTLVAADRLRAEADTRALLRGKIHLYSFDGEGIRADLPAIRTRFPAGEAKDEGEGEDGPPPFRIDLFRLEAPFLRLTPERTIRNGTVRGSAAFAGVGAASVRIDTIAAGEGNGAWRIDGGAIAFDSGEGAPSGRIRFRAEGGPDARIAVDAREGGMFRLRGTFAAAPSGPVSTLDLEGTLLRAEERLRAVRFTGTIEAPAGAAPVRPAGLALPPGPAALRIRGEVVLAPEPALRLYGDWIPGPFLRGGGFALRCDRSLCDLDSLTIRLDGASLSVAGSVRGEEREGRASFRLRGTEAIATLGLDSLLAGVEDPWIVAEASALRGPKGRTFTAGAALGAVVRGTAIDTVRARVEGRGDRIAIDLFALARERILEVSATVREKEGAREAALEPLLLRAAGSPRPVPPAGTGEATLRRGRGGEWTARNVTLLGEPGLLRLDGRFEDGGGDFRLRWSGAEPLPPLFRAASREEEAGGDSLRARWRREGPFRAEIEGRFVREEGDLRIEGEGDLRLPGPSLLAPVPSGAADRFGPVEGTVRLVHTGARATDLRLDLGATAWLDTALLRVRADGDRIALDSARIAMDGLRIEGNGMKEGGGWEGTGRLSLDDPALLRSLVPSLPEDLDFALRAEGGVRGGPAGTEGEARFEGGGRGAGWDAPRFEGSFLLDEAGWSGDVRLDGGVLAGPVRLDTLRGTFLLPAGGDPRVRVDGGGDGIGLRAACTIRREEEMVLEGETFALFLGGRDLHTLRPFLLRSGPGGPALDGLRMEGRLGSLRADGSLHSDSSDLALRVDLDLPRRPEGLLLPDDFWPDRIFLERGTGTEGVPEATIRVAGLPRAGGAFDGEVRLRGDSTGADFRGFLTEERDTLFASEGRLPLLLAPFPPRFAGADEPLLLHTAFRRFPFLLPGGAARRGRGPKALLEGTVRLEGTARRPSASANLEVLFPGAPRLAGRRLTLDASYDAAREGGADSAAGLRAEAALREGERSLLRADLLLPLRWTPSPPSLRRGGGTMALKIRSEELELSGFNDLIPPSFSLGGSCSFRLDAEGDPDDPALSGRFDVDRLLLAGMEGSRVEIDGGLDLGGTGKAPSARGAFELKRGVLRVPEDQKALHPAEGEAVLWSLAPDREEDPGPASPPAAEKEDGEEMARAFDLDVGLNIPSGLWIRGRGLEVELAGDLRLLQKGGLPTVAGELRAKRGSLLFLGRAFRVERGVVTFFGEDEADPTMDLVLAARVEGTVVRVLVGGTVRRPELSLRSEPEMSEGDILSVLLFGRPLDGLDHDQMLLVQRRAGEMAAFVGAARMGARLSRDLGVDLVTLSDGRGREGGRSLVIGKYISRRLLLKYEQPIEGRSALFVALEYFLTGRLRVETLFGRGDQSAIGLGWGKDY